MNRNDKEFIIQKIRTQYTEKKTTELDTLKKLDAKVKRPAGVFAYILGILAALVMGFGMSLVMTDLADTLDIGEPMVIGIAVGIIGLVMAIVNYPVYKAILASRRRKYADRIVALADEMMEK